MLFNIKYCIIDPYLLFAEGKILIMSKAIIAEYCHASRLLETKDWNSFIQYYYNEPILNLKEWGNSMDIQVEEYADLFWKKILNKSLTEAQIAQLFTSTPDGDLVAKMDRFAPDNTLILIKAVASFNRLLEVKPNIAFYTFSKLTNLTLEEQVFLITIPFDYASSNFSSMGDLLFNNKDKKMVYDFLKLNSLYPSFDLDTKNKWVEHYQFLLNDRETIQSDIIW